MNYLRHIFLFSCLLTVIACGAEAAPTPTAILPAATAVPPTTIPATLPPPVVSDASTEEAAAAAIEPAPTAAQTPIFPWPAARFGYGIQSHAVVGDPKFAMEVIDSQLGLDWVKIQLEWPLIQPDPETRQWFFYDGALDEAYNHGLNVMLSVVGAPEWTRAAGGENGPPDDYNLYATFLTEVLDRYAGKVHAIEVWNEQNIIREWATADGISPPQYVDFLRVAYEAVKAKDPNVIVISGALAPTGVHDGVNSYDDFIYLDEALPAGLLNYADCVGVHHNGYNIGPDVAFDETGSLPEAATAEFRGPFDNPHHSWSFKTTLDVYTEKVQAFDPNKKLCITEFGWASSEGYDQVPENFEYARDNTLEEQATFIVQAFQQMHASGDVWLSFLFNFDFGNKGNGPTDDNVPYSLVDLQGIPRPAFGAVAAMEKPN